MLAQSLLLFMVPSTLTMLNYVRAVPGDHKTFVDFLQERRAWWNAEDQKPTMERMLGTREMGTFWWAPDATGFSEPRAINNRPDTKNWPGECAVAFYYDDMSLRLRQLQESLERHDSGDDTFARPLAIAPLCGGPTRKDWKEPIEGDKFPAPHERAGRVVFNNYRSYTDRDAYFVLQNANNIEKDCLVMEDFRGYMMQYAMADDVAQIDSTWTPEIDGVPAFGVEMFRDWMIQFTKSREGEFCIPNPRKFGRGSKRWSDWYWLSTFWGYMDDGSWSDKFDKAPNLPPSKRSRIEGWL